MTKSPSTLSDFTATEIEAYANNRITQQELADRHGVSKQAISKRLSRAGIKRARKSKEAASTGHQKDFERDGFTKDDAADIAASAAFGIVLMVNKAVIEGGLGPSALKALSATLKAALETLTDLGVTPPLVHEPAPAELVVRMYTEDEEAAIRENAEQETGALF